VRLPDGARAPGAGGNRGWPLLGGLLPHSCWSSACPAGSPLPGESSGFLAQSGVQGPISEDDKRLVLRGKASKV